MKHKEKQQVLTRDKLSKNYEWDELFIKIVAA